MNASYVSVEKQKIIRERSKHSCEYCLAPAEYFYLGSYHIDHIISESQGGSNELDNLAFSCPTCNRNKGSNLSAFIVETQEVIRLYHPRKDRRRSEHFNLKDNGELHPLSSIGKATIRLLKLNLPETVFLRSALLSIGYL